MRAWGLAVPTGVRMRLRGTRLARLYAQAHQRVYRGTGGLMGGRLTVPGHPRAPLLLLTTVGRTTGVSRTTPLIYAVDQGRFVVAAANAGHPRHPAWWRNLLADPTASLVVRRRRIDVRARQARGNERAALWQRLVAVYPPLAEYQRATDRRIPVVVLDPVP
jgi:deazaflavin-dependent oxidoreductase (nitroreductase family)